jgi:hypothetical protein
MGQNARRRQPLYSGRVAPVCDRLRSLFDPVASERVPDQLTALADRLDGALERGELCSGKDR